MSLPPQRGGRSPSQDYSSPKRIVVCLGYSSEFVVPNPIRILCGGESQGKSTEKPFILQDSKRQLGRFPSAVEPKQLHRCGSGQMRCSLDSNPPCCPVSSPKIKL